MTHGDKVHELGEGFRLLGELGEPQRQRWRDVGADEVGREGVERGHEEQPEFPSRAPV